MTPKKLIITLIATLIVLNLFAWLKTVVSVSAQVNQDPQALPQNPTNSLACQKFGVNFGVAYAVDDQQYQRAEAHSLGWTLAIAHASDPQATIDGINRALAKKLTPIVRIGVGPSSLGFINPQDYVNFLNKVAAGVNGTFYAVAGPNEPEFEHWLAQEPGKDPACLDYSLDAPGDPDFAKAGLCLAKYTAVLLDANIDPKVKLLSPSFSLTGWMSAELIDNMETALKGLNHSLAELDGFSGTSYSGVNGKEDIAVQIAKVTSRFPSLPIVLTEFSDGDGNQDLVNYKAIVDFVKTDPRAANVLGTTFFCAFGTCSNWDGFILTDAELNQILGPECAADFVTAKTKRPTPRETMRPCTTEDNPEFHPLRPYPGEPCDPLIPRSDPRADRVAPKTTQSWQAILEADRQMRNSLAFSCGNSLTPLVSTQFDQGLGREENMDTNGDGQNDCTRNGNRVTCYIRHKFTLTLDLKNANIPILGNTQTGGLTDAQKMTEYLSWFLNGTVQQSEQNPKTSTKRLINFSGPLQKLLPFDLKNWDRSELVMGPAGEPFDPPNGDGQYHNYIVGCNQVVNIDIGDYIDALKNLLGASWSAAVDVATIATKLAGVALADAKTIVNYAYAAYRSSPNDPKQALQTFTQQISSAITDPGTLSRAIDLASYLLEKGGDFLASVDAALSAIQPIEPNQAIVCSDPNLATTVKRLKDFRQHLPPDPTQYDSFNEYWAEYVKWSGAANLPFNLGSIDVPWRADVWEQLFQNIPFSSLEDTTGEVVISVSDIEAHNQQDKDVVDAITKTGEKPVLMIRKVAP